MPSVLDETQSFALDAFYFFRQCTIITLKRHYNTEKNIRNNNLGSGHCIADVTSHTKFLSSSDMLSVQVVTEFH